MTETTLFHSSDIELRRRKASYLDLYRQLESNPDIHISEPDAVSPMIEIPNYIEVFTNY